MSMTDHYVGYYGLPDARGDIVDLITAAGGEFIRFEDHPRTGFCYVRYSGDDACIARVHEACRALPYYGNLHIGKA